MDTTGDVSPAGELTSVDRTLLRTRELRKAFSGTVAIENVSIDLEPGKVVAVVGENGAGKSTLKNLLIGLLEPDNGYIELEGERLPSRFHAADLGIAAVHQEFSLFNDLSVAENICIVGLPGTRPLVNWRRTRETATEYLEMIGADLDPDVAVSTLSTGEQQLVEIAKALRHASKVLILDEPTTSLTNPERELLFSIIRKLKQSGLAIIFISHFIEEVYDIADQAIVLRDGHYVGGGTVADLPRRRLEELMVGRPIEDRKTDTGTPGAEIVLKVEDLASDEDVKGVSFELHKGEILGLSGLMGAGRTELVEAIFGLRPRSGNVWISGRRIHANSAAAMRKLGVSFVPEDRRRNGLFGIRSLKENLTIAAIRRLVQRAIPGIGFKGERDSATRLADEMRIAYSGIEREVRFLSGGNQQKALLARWLAIEPSLCILDEPTRGVDIGAKEEIHNLIGKLARSGVAVLMVSSELPELMRLSHRIIILRKGKAVKELAQEEFDPMTIIQYAASETAEHME
jgi:ABC-type sugar transport system ATPase subunit